MRRSRVLALVAGALVLAALALADLEVTATDPWTEIGRFARGILTPDFGAPAQLGEALALTLGVAFLGVGAAAVAGLVVAPLYRYAPVRWVCAGLRSVHELFWALLLQQALGLSPLTGVVAIALPYAATFARVYAEILEETPTPALALLPADVGGWIRFVYIRLPQGWPQIAAYTSYRVECGLRSSAVLGFIGLPTLGFHLHTFFKQGLYAEASAVLIVFFVLIGTLRYWLRRRLLVVALPISALLIAGGPTPAWSHLGRFLTRDIVPAPLRDGTGGWPDLQPWLTTLLRDQAAPGILATLVLTILALAASGLLALALFPWASRLVIGRAQAAGHVGLVVLRSTPEYILTYAGLQMLGPSMLPALIALAVHNGAIVAHLLARHADGLRLRPGVPRGLNLLSYEILPRLRGPFLALLFYRADIILRESAILGVLGVRTLGFFVDSAMAELRFDRVVILILATAGVNITVEALLRRARLGRRVEAAARLEASGS